MYAKYNLEKIRGYSNGWEGVMRFDQSDMCWIGKGCATTHMGLLSRILTTRIMVSSLLCGFMVYVIVTLYPPLSSMMASMQLFVALVSS
jgi:hypothetical protein